VSKYDRDAKLPGSWKATARKLGIDGLSRDETARHFWVYTDTRPFGQAPDSTIKYLVCEHWGRDTIESPAEIANELVEHNAAYAKHADERKAHGDFDGVNRIAACEQLIMRIFNTFSLSCCPSCRKFFEGGYPVCPSCKEKIAATLEPMRQALTIGEQVEQVLELAGATMVSMLQNGISPICFILSQPRDQDAVQGVLEFSAKLRITAQDKAGYDLSRAQTLDALKALGLVAVMHDETITDANSPGEVSMPSIDPNRIM
jgi:hypothetical protein